MASKGTRRSTTTNKRRKGLGANMLPWLRRFGMVLACLGLLAWAGAWFFLSEADTKTADWIDNKIVQTTASLGFTVDNIMLQGRVHADTDVLKAIINTQKDDPLFSFEPESAKTLIERMTWVKAAHVERRWPNTIYIKLQERKPLALLQQNKKLKLLDQSGEVIAAKTIEPFKTLVIVMGQGAAKKAPTLLQTLMAEPDLYAKTDSAGLISGRRWDLVLKNGVRIKLPEHDMGLALSRLTKAQNEDKLLDKNLTTIDVRDNSRIVIRTKPGAVQEYQEYKAGFPTKKSNAKSNI